MRLLLSLLFIVFCTNAKVIKYEVLGSKKESYTIQEVCKKMGFKHLLLVELKDKVVDCMGKHVDPVAFCKTLLLADPHFIRAFIDKENEKVVCQKGNDVALSVVCDKRDNKFCEDAKAGCTILKDVFAVNLNLIHQTLLYQAEHGRVLSCHYSVQKI